MNSARMVLASETENTSTADIKELGGGMSDGNPLVTSILARQGRDSIRNINSELVYGALALLYAFCLY